MALNHLNLTVTDVLATKAFLEKYFDFHAVMEGNEKMTFLSDGSMMLSMFKSTDVSYPKDFHIGFLQETEEQVSQINQRLKDDGFDVPEPKRLQGGRWSFYFDSPGGFVIEVECVKFGD
jgi:lactoylglutathione lyase